MDCLKSNTTLKELYLPSSKLYSREAQCLGNFLQVNTHLKVLDISNNFIGDRGLEGLSKGLAKQNIVGTGLSVFIVFNNQLTEKSGPVINSIIVSIQIVRSPFDRHFVLPIEKQYRFCLIFTCLLTTSMI